MTERREEARRKTPHLSLRRKADLLGIHLSGLYYQSRPKDDEIDLMNALQDLYAKYPFMGYRRLTVMLQREGYFLNEKRTLRLMRLMGLQALYPKKNLSKRRQEDAVYPYLLKDCPPKLPNNCWQVDITYLRMATGFVYLTALIDVVSRRVMGWSLSLFLETESCLAALDAALKKGECPSIINSDQGSQFTSTAWTERLSEGGIAISMDGKGRCLDNVHIERFWRSLKYEEVYLKTYETVFEARKAIGDYIDWYNCGRPHQALGYQTPDEVFYKGLHPVDNGENSIEFPPFDHNRINNIINQVELR